MRPLYCCIRVLLTILCFYGRWDLASGQGESGGANSVDGVCNEGYACVPWQNCVEDESLGRPSNFDEAKCGDIDHMCCEVSDSLLTSLFDEFDNAATQDLPTDCGHASYDCVPYFQCVEGKINTDGSGLLDLRTRTTSSCYNPDYPDVPALCCLIPGADPTPTPVEECPTPLECVEFAQCSADGKIITDGTGLIDIRTGYTSCYLGSGISGRCCSPPEPQVDECPSGSSCVSPDQCTENALGITDSFSKYTSDGLWSRCPVYDRGVCCTPTSKSSDLNPSSFCGVRNENVGSRILSSKDSAFGEFPWQSIIFYQNYTFVCGASLISEKFLVTAAHCVNGIPAEDLRIRLGEWQVSAFDEPLSYLDTYVSNVHVHPSFNPSNLKYDVAVLELTEPLTYQYHINRICLPEYGYTPAPGSECIATGWGKDSFSGDFQTIMKKVSLPFVEHGECQSLLRKTRLGRYFKLHDSFVCAGGDENKDACFGDGGGPLVCKSDSSDVYYLVGITSWGIGCGEKGVPGVYTNVQFIVNWILEHSA